jgi:ABC-type branched-subunit amino acid transport system ATPase component
MLKIRNIYKSFGGQRVLNGVSFELEKGKVYSLVGGNGSGKTTLFNIISGFIQPDSGKIEFNNKEITNKTPYEINNLGVARTFQDLRIVQNITVRDNVLLALRRFESLNIFKEFINFKKSDYEKADSIIEQVSLTSEMNSLADEISYGQQKLLTIGCCLANDSELLLLDEPIAGIDKENYKKMRSLIESLHTKHSKCIIQIEHNLDYIRETSDEIFFLINGSETVFTSYDSFINNREVQEAYIN